MRSSASRCVVSHALWLSAASVAAIAAPTHASLSWNAGADFSPTSNPSGPWSYGTRSTSAGSAFSSLNDTASFGPVQGWFDKANNSLGTPLIAKNTSSSTFQSGSVTWLAGDFTMHPGPVGFGSREFAVTRWTSPISGPISIFGGFLPADSGSTDVFVVLNGTTIFSAFRSGGMSSGFDLLATVGVGDTVDFVVGNAGDFTFDTTVLNANIVPTPGAAAGVLLGAGAMGLRRRRR